MPARIARLPRARNGYPIIAAIHRDNRGQARFDTVDDTRKLILGILDWCGVCGLPLGDHDRHLVVISDGDRPMNDGTSTTEPPVHALCAHYAARVCPFLLTPGKTIRKGPAQGKVCSGLDLIRHHHVGGVVWQPEGIAFTLLGPEPPVTLDTARETFEELLTEEPPVELSTRHRLLLQAFEAANPLPILYAAAVTAAHAPNLRLAEELGEVLENARTVAHLHESELRGHPVYKLVPLLRAWIRERGSEAPPMVLASALQEMLLA